VSTPIAAALSSNRTPSLRLSVPACGSNSKSLGNESGNVSDVTCERGWCVAGGRRKAVGRWVAACRDGAVAWLPLDGATVVIVVVRTADGVTAGAVPVRAEDTTTGRVIAGAAGADVWDVDADDLTSACGAGSGEGWPD